VDADEEISDDKEDRTIVDSQAHLVHAEKRLLAATNEIGLLGKDSKDHPGSHARELDRLEGNVVKE
jgi:hypothetical protein